MPPSPIEGLRPHMATWCAKRSGKLNVLARRRPMFVDRMFVDRMGSFINTPKMAVNPKIYGLPPLPPTSDLFYNHII